MRCPHTIDALTDTEHQQLDTHQFNATTFETLKNDLLHKRRTAQSNHCTEDIRPPASNDLTPWPTGNRLARYHAMGQDACHNGSVAMVILNGGMATRFGHSIKGLTEIAPNLSLLGLRIALTAQASPNIPIFVMNSFATQEATATHLQHNNYFGADPQRIHMLTQSISVRLTPEGQIFRTADGHISPYAPGHGDVFETLLSSPAYRQFVISGGQAVMISNVDNPMATLSPTVIGMHFNHPHAVTVEVTDRLPGDSGGCPVWINDKMVILEGIRLPPTLNTHQLPFFNTNTLTIDVGAIRAHPLQWHYVEKNVNEHTVVQFERLMGEITSFVGASYLHVPRTGSQNRFLPIKNPSDLPGAQKLVAEMIKDRRLVWARGFSSPSAA